MESILGRKFKTPYFTIIKFDNFREIRAMELNFPKLRQYPKYPKTSITQPSDCLGT